MAIGVADNSVPSIKSCALPPDSLLQGIANSGAFVDCYTTTIDRSVSQAAFIEAFYTTAIFKLERLILRVALARPSTDTEARQLARGDRDSFAAWSVEQRSAEQLLLRDFAGRTRSWLMVSTPSTGQSSLTQLYFGSAVVPLRNPKTGRSRMSFAFSALLGFHKLYSPVLLLAAKSRLTRKMESDDVHA